MRILGLWTPSALQPPGPPSVRASECVRVRLVRVSALSRVSVGRERIKKLGVRVECLVFRVQCLVFWAYGLGFRVGVERWTRALARGGWA